MGNPIPSAIRVIDKDWKELGNFQTADNGYFELTIPGSEKLSVSASPFVSRPQHYIGIEGGFRVSRYFELTKTIISNGDKVEVEFVLARSAHLWIVSYSPEGAKMQMGEFNSQVSPPWYGPVYGAFPMDSFSLPVPTGPSIGQLRPAWHPEKGWGQWEPYFAVPPGEAIYLMMLWPVPTIGTIPLRADNRGQGYNLREGEVLPLNLVYEFAETEHRRTLERKSSYEAMGYHLSADVVDWLSQASDYLNEARGQTDGKSRALLSYKVLTLSVKAKEQMTMEVVGKGIEGRNNELTVIVQDETGAPVPEARVTYSQTRSDFVLGYGSGLPSPRHGFLHPSLKAGKEVGFEYLYDMTEGSWGKASPEKGVYDFSEHDLALRRAKDLGYETVGGLLWLGGASNPPPVPSWTNFPAWAEGLEFSEYKQHLHEFVKKAAEHLRGKVKYLNLVVEPSLLTIVGSRYVDVEFESNYVDGLKANELIELVQTVFQAAREVDSGILLGYSVVPSYNYWQLNPTPFGGKPSPYSLLKSMLEKGVSPDYIGVEFQHGTIQVPIDLSAFAEMIQAYHDLSGLPVFITEMSSYPSRAGDYGLTDPAPNVYWHEGMTQKAQAEWDSSVFKIAMGLPYVLGVQMVHILPDNPEWGRSLYGGTFLGTDYLTQDHKPKQVYYAMKELFDSWRAQGAAVTNVNGKVSFKGFSGNYTIAVTTAEGLLQTFETHLGPESRVVAVTLDRAKAIEEARHLIAEAQRGVDWSQKVGRELDYTGFRSRLEEAKSAIAIGDYERARTIAERLLDAIAFRIDGNPDDWKGIQPIATAPLGGVKVKAHGIDLKALYGVSDDKYLYMMVEVYDPPIVLQPERIGDIIFPQFLFDLRTDKDEQHHLRTYLPYGGQADVWLLTKPTQVLATLYTVAYGKVFELRVPQALLDNPSRVSVHAFVMAAEDGKEKPEKWFEGYVQVIGP